MHQATVFLIDLNKVNAAFLHKCLKLHNVITLLFFHRCTVSLTEVLCTCFWGRNNRRHKSNINVLWGLPGCCCGVSISDTSPHYQWGSNVCCHGDRLSWLVNKTCDVSSLHLLRVHYLTGDWSIVLLKNSPWVMTLSTKCSSNKLKNNRQFQIVNFLQLKSKLLAACIIVQCNHLATSFDSFF